MGIIVVLIIIFLAWRVLAIRAYTGFSLTVIGIGAFIAGFFMEDHFFVIPGAVMCAAGLLIAYLSVIHFEPSARPGKMLTFLIYGMFIFIKIICIALIIFIPLASIFSAMAADYKEMIVIDEYGRDTGRRVTVDTSTGRGTDGRKYRIRRDDPYE